MQKSLDFKYVSSEALKSMERILAHYLPGGITKGDEYFVLNPTRDDKKIGWLLLI